MNENVDKIVNHERFLLGIPAVATVLVWMWVGSMNLLQSPGNSLFMLGLLTTVSTAVLAAMETGAAPRPEGARSPTAWFFMIALLWIVAYPMYMYQRRHRGLANRLLPAAVLAVVFCFSYFAMNANIETKRAAVLSNIEEMRARFSNSDRN